MNPKTPTTPNSKPASEPRLKLSPATVEKMLALTPAQREEAMLIAAKLLARRGRLA